MTPPPYEQPGAGIAFWVLLALFALGEYALRLRSHLHRTGSRPRERWSLVVVLGSVGGGLFGGLALARSRTGAIVEGRWALFVLGLALMATGLAVRQWAILTLGRFFTVDVRIHQGQTVVDRGPYRWVRHPSYTGLLLFLLGLGLALSDWASLLVLVALPAAGLLVRIRSEERALLDALGQDYRDYAARRARLLPGVW